jgi:hypothetical protein
MSAMQTELHQLERYLHDDLGVGVNTTPWRGKERLPHFLKELYGFAEPLRRMWLLSLRHTGAFVGARQEPSCCGFATAGAEIGRPA